jgi:hypothetical protein
MLALAREPARPAGRRGGGDRERCAGAPEPLTEPTNDHAPRPTGASPYRSKHPLLRLFDAEPFHLPAASCRRFNARVCEHCGAADQPVGWRAR